MVLRRKTVTAEHQEKVDYYANDESIAKEKTAYYAKGKTLAKGNALWIGALKSEFELEDEIIQSTFKEISYGTHPVTKERLKGHGQKHENKDRLFHDNCYSPNKSISIAGLVLGQTEIIDAHNETIAELAQYSEAKYGSYRDQSNGESKTVHTGKMLFAAINHYTARPVKESGEIFVDPQLHTHLLAMNTTLTPDGKWRALQHESLSNDASLGFIYNQKMALKLQERGFQIRETKDGFELADISDEQIAIFSKRRQQAKKKLQAEGAEITPKSIQIKVLSIRQTKQSELTLDDLKEHWAEQAEGISITKHDRVERIGHGTVEEELQGAINHLSERSVSFHVSNINQYIFRYVQRFSPEALEQAIAEHSELIDLGNDRFSTVAAVKQELAIFDMWQSGIGGKEPLIESVSLNGLRQEYWIAGKKIQLNESQAIAIKNALESDHQFQVIKGLAGVGKTTAIAEFISQLKSSGADVELFGFAGTHEAKSELEKSLKIQSRTVASLTTSGSEGRIWVVDEAGLNSNREWVEVLEMAKKQDVRVIMLGDPGQNSSVEAGSPMSAVINKFPETVQKMSEIIRQQNKQQLKAVELISAGRGAEAIVLLGENGWLQQIEDRQKRAQAIAKLFTAMPVKEQEKTVIVTGTNRERVSITEAVRAGLKEQGILGDSMTIDILKSRNLSKQQAKEVRNFTEGDWVKFYNVPRSGFMKAGELYKVKKIDGDTLSIETIEGRSYRVSPSKFQGNIDVLYTESMDIAVGDRTRLTATVKQKDWHNGKQLVITKVSGEFVEGTDNDGKKHRIDTLTPVAIDHDWVGTSYRRQGKTARNALIVLTSDATSSQEPVTVSISRQTHNIQVITENSDELLRLVQRSNRQANVLDELGTDDRSLAELKAAIADFEKNGGKVRDYIKPKKKEAESKPTNELVKQWTENYNRLLSRIKRQTVEQNIEELTSGRFNTNSRDFGSSHREPGNTQRYSEQIGVGRVTEAQGWREQNVESGRSANGYSREYVDTTSASTEQSIDRDSKVAAIAERIFQIQLSKQLAEPLARLSISLEKLSTLERQNDALRLTINEFLHDSLMRHKDTVISSALQEYREMHPIAPPKKLEVWQPNYEGVPKPENLEEHHWKEMQKSAIHPDLVKLNIESVEGHGVSQRLLEDYFSGIGAGQIRTSEMKKWLKKYEQLNDGGWWGKAGIEAKSLNGLQLGQKPQLSTNGVFKGDRPRTDIDGKAIKYENPKGLDRPFFLANVPDWLAEKIYKKHNINPTEAEKQSGFWHIVQTHNVPIVLVEGYKKALSSLSQGIVTIGTPGVTLYKANEKGADGQTLKMPKREILEDLKVFATPGREITIANDQDTKLKTKFNVRQANIRSAEVLAEQGSIVKIAYWDAKTGKGADDQIINNGPRSYVRAISEARGWESQAQKYYEAQYRSAKTFAEKALGANVSAKAIDAEIYTQAVRRGDRLDGDRLLKVSPGYIESGEQYLREVTAIVMQRKTPQAVSPKALDNEKLKLDDELMDSQGFSL